MREWTNCEKSRFIFTGKERDVETGYDNFGARLYDGDLGRFLSVDPLAAKYAGWSSYAYVMNNPLIFVDPTGAEIQIAISGYQTDEEGNYILDGNGDKIAVSGNIKYTPGMALTGNRFADAVIQALDGLTSRGADHYNIIGTLANDDNPIVISEISWKEQNFSNINSIQWSMEGGLIHEDRVGRHSPAVSLLHELGHSYWHHYDPIGERKRENSALEKGLDVYNGYLEEELSITGGSHGFKGYEEMWVIKSVEHFAVKALGQALRTSHGKAGKFKAISLFSVESTEEYFYPNIRY